MWRLLLFSLLAAVIPSPAFAAGGSEVDPMTYVIWGGLFTVAYFASSQFKRLGQAGVVGALIAGVLVAALDGVITIPDMAIVSTFGMAALLFEAGLESDLNEMMKELLPSITVAVVGVILPAIGGAAYASWAMGITNPAEVGTYAVAFTATSVGISLQVLKQMKQDESREARIIIGAAVLDDILGMSGLAALSGVVAAGVVSAMGLISPVAIGLAFIFGFMFFGIMANKMLLGERESLAIAAFFSTVALAISSYLGIAIIIATFVAGAVMNAEKSLHKAVEGVGIVLYAPAFLAVGLLMDWSVMSWSILPDIIFLSILAFFSKFAAGYAYSVLGWVVKLVSGKHLDTDFNRPLVGSAMASRGEVGLAVIAIAKGSGWITSESFAILTATVILVTIVAPFAMKHFIKDSSLEVAQAT